MGGLENLFDSNYGEAEQLNCIELAPTKNEHEDTRKEGRRQPGIIRIQEKGRVAQESSARVICEPEVAVNIRGHYHAPIVFLGDRDFFMAKARGRSSIRTNEP